VSVMRFDVQVPHESIGPRAVPRAAGLWRVIQTVVMRASIQAGWPAARFQEEGVGFVVVAMSVRHHREPRFHEALEGRTWVKDFRRRSLSHREVRLLGPGGFLLDATQRWAHVDRSGALCPASHAVMADFPPTQVDDPSVRLDRGQRDPSDRWHEHTLDCWFHHVDYQGHANHPMFIEWMDEATARAVRGAGLSPHDLVPVAEELHFQAAVPGGEPVTVRSRVRGRTADAVVLEHRLTSPEGKALGRGLTWRKLLGQPVERLEAALR